MAEDEDYGLMPIGEDGDEDDDGLDTFGQWAADDELSTFEDGPEDLSAFDVDVSAIKGLNENAGDDFFAFQDAQPRQAQTPVASTELDPSKVPNDIDRDLASMLHSMVIPAQHAVSHTPERGTSRIESRFASSNSASPLANQSSIKLLSRPDQSPMKLTQPDFGAPVNRSSIPTSELSEQQQKFLMQLTGKKDHLGAVVEPKQEPRDASRSQNPQRRQRWNQSSEMMSADEIDMIIRIQEQQLGSESNPFLEDYYAQQYQLLQNPRQYQLHRPIMDPVSTQPRPVRRQGSNTPTKHGKVEEKEKEDPFQHVLGRIPSHSVRAPRPLLVFDSEGDSSAASLNPDSEARASATMRATLQRIEAAFVTVLELEDLVQLMQQINTLISQAPSPAQAQIVLQQLQSNFNLGTLMGKRQQHCVKLIGQLGLLPLPKETPPNRLVEWDEGVLALISVPKGARVLARSLPLFVSTATPTRDAAPLLPFVEIFDRLTLSLVRNSATISASVQSERHQLDISILADFARTHISRADPAAFSSLVQHLLIELSAHASAGPAYVTALCSFRYGSHIITSLLKRLFELCQVPTNLSDMERVSIWRTFYNVVYTSLQGSFSRLVTNASSIASACEPAFTKTFEKLGQFGVRIIADSTLSSSYRVVATPAAIELILYVAANAAAHQKLQIQLELAPVLPSLMTRENMAGLASLSKLIGTPNPTQ